MLASPMAAQNAATTGAIRGRVIDAANTPVPTASVTAREINTGQLRIGTTNASGDYLLPLLPPGTYNVSVRAIGFAVDSLRGIGVGVGQTATANFTMRAQAVVLQALEATTG